MARPAKGRVAVSIEAGKKKAFATAMDWPGWSRSGRDEAAALEALLAAAPRYAAVAGEAGAPFPARPDLEVVERVPGSGSTEFGVPGEVTALDRRPLTAKEAERQVALLTAAWAALARAAAAAPAELRKGPRGGGRDRDAIVAHVVEAEVSGYARKLGLKLAAVAPADDAAVAAGREAIIDVLRRASDGSPLGPKGWPPRYAARRIAWHALDHAWEIEDRSS